MGQEPRSFGAHLKALREAAGFTQEELATIAGLSVHAVSALERGERRRPHVETVRALSAALDLTPQARDAFVARARPPAHDGVNELGVASLPLPMTALVGRDRDIVALRQWLGDPRTRLITLTGPGGVGKTRLALEVAHGVAKEGAARVTFASLAALRDAAFVAPSIAEALGLSDVVEGDLATRVRGAFRDSPALLVLDNFEHVLGAAPLVAELLATVVSLRLLITSRAPLHIRGEREYAVGPLGLEASAETMAPADLARVPAVRLFVERVRDVYPDFQLTAANGPTVTAICRHLDALPLALELAAPWIKVLTAEGLLRQLERDVLLSSVVGPRDLPQRQQTMNDTVAWSYQLLDGQEQGAFRRFGALPGVFPIEAAAAVLAGRERASGGDAEALRATARLIEKSLLRRIETSAMSRPLYVMLETVRAYATGELMASGERDDALEGLARYCTTEASSAGRELVGPAQVEWLDRVQEDLESYRGAMSWLVEHGRPAEAAEIAWRLIFYWLIRGRTTEGLRWYEQILRVPSLPPAAELKVLVGSAEMLCVQGQLERARSALGRALALADGGHDAEILAQAATMQGRVELAFGNLAAARDWWSEATSKFEALRMPWGVGNGLFGLASVALAGGKADEAERLLDEATSALRPAGPWFLTRTLYVRAALAVQRGNAHAAIAAVRDGLTRIRDLQDRFALMYTLVPLAAAAALKGDDVWAARVLGAWDAVGESTGARLVLKPLADLHRRTERDVQARLGAHRWTQAHAAGRKSSIDALLREVDTALGASA